MQDTESRGMFSTSLERCVMNDEALQKTRHMLTYEIRHWKSSAEECKNAFCVNSPTRERMDKNGKTGKKKNPHSLNSRNSNTEIHLNDTNLHRPALMRSKASVNMAVEAFNVCNHLRLLVFESSQLKHCHVCNS